MPSLSLTYRSLYQSDVVSVRDYSCRGSRSDPAVEERSGDNTIVLMRRGSFCKHLGKRSVTADVNQAVFFSKSSTYRISHPADCGDRGTVFSLAEGVLRDIVRELDPSVEEHPERPFPFAIGPCGPEVFSGHREIVRRLSAAKPGTVEIEPLWVDATSLQLVADVVKAAFDRHGRPTKRRRRGTDEDHADRAEAAKTYLASRLEGRITLDDVSRAVHASPFHLTRVFRQRTGMPIHRYLTRLRLRASLEFVMEGAKDLTALALDLGFSSHSHFTDAFRREFGRPPSDVRRIAGRRTLRDLSKNLEV
jgi:AraC family transcriptional regulator